MKKNDSPFFSIIIPTRNRYNTLKYTIRTILNQNFESFEIIISDNSNQEFLNQITNINEYLSDSRIIYHRPPSVLSMTDNWDFAVSKASGQFLILLGDDDGLIEGALGRISDILRKSNADMISWARVEYSWPDRIPKQSSNLMFIPYMGKTGIINSKSYIKKVVRYEADYRYLPMIYNSAVSADLIHQLKEKFGKVFNAWSPDLFSGYALATLQKKYISVGFPLSINGVSSTSNGAAHLNEDEDGMKDYKELLSDSTIKWPESLPQVNTPYIAIVEPFVQLSLLLPELKDYISRKEIYKVIIDTLDGTIRKDKDKKLKQILESSKNNPLLYKWTLKYIQKVKNNVVVESDIEEGIKLGFDGWHLILDASKFGIENVYDASIFVNNLFGEIKDWDFFKPALPDIYTRIKKAGAFILRGI